MVDQDLSHLGYISREICETEVAKLFLNRDGPGMSFVSFSSLLGTNNRN